MIVAGRGCDVNIASAGLVVRGLIGRPGTITTGAATARGIGATAIATAPHAHG